MAEWFEGLGLLGLFLGTFLAATVVPFSSDALYIAIVVATGNPVACFLVGTAGNWLGSVATYWIGYLGKLEWIEKWFRISTEKLERQQASINRYGVWLALLAWVPFIGDVLAIGLGFYKVKPSWTMLLFLIGKAARFLIWNLTLSLL